MLPARAAAVSTGGLAVALAHTARAVQHNSRCMAASEEPITVYGHVKDSPAGGALDKLSQASITVEHPSGVQQVAFAFPTGQPDGSNAPSFRSCTYLQHLTATGLGRVILSAASLPSTQTLLQHNAVRLPDGVVCVVDQQAAGKGRGGNLWSSPVGCLMFSVNKVLHIGGDRLPFLQYVVSLAIVQAVQQLAAEALQGKRLDVRIKWPNDIYAGGQKIGGILCHSSYRAQQFQVTIGCGINVTNEQPTTCIAHLISESQRRHNLPESPALEREVLLAAIISTFEQLLETLRTAGFGPLRPSYLSAWLHSGQQVTLVEGSDHAPREVQLTVEGITDTGYLLARDAAGQAFELHPDGNSLDFFKGLVRRKLPA